MSELRPHRHTDEAKAKISAKAKARWAKTFEDREKARRERIRKHRIRLAREAGVSEDRIERELADINI